MVTFKCNIYNEEEETGKIIGAEVIVYNSSNDNIATIEIVDAETLAELEAKLDALDSTYLTYDEVMEILANSSETNIINATLLNGFASDDFAKKNHTHSEYAPSAHTIVQGSKTTAGHVKTIDSLNTTRYISGEALSAYQGGLLNKRLTTIEHGEQPRVVIGRLYDHGGEEGSRIIITQGDKIYVRTYGVPANTEIQIIISNVLYTHVVDEQGYGHRKSEETGSISNDVGQAINLNKGNYVIYAVLTKKDTYARCEHHKLLVVS